MTSPNLVIIQLLHTQTNHSDFLRVCWDKLTSIQKRDVFHFLFLSSQHKTFLNALRMEINVESPTIPWTHLFAILKASNKLNEHVIRTSTQSLISTDEMGRFRIDDFNLPDLWIKRKEGIWSAYEDKKNELLKNLSVARQQGFKEQRLKILDELKRFCPDDPDVLTALQSERELLARNTIHKVFQKKLAQNDWFSTSSDVDPQFSKSTFKAAKKHIKKKPEAVLDLALLFSQMEMYHEALELIQSVKNKTPRVLWYALQISIDGRQYAQSLSLIESLRNEKLTNDNSFSLLYYQAIALFGLGQKNEAKQIIANIVKIRPDFKSADSLMIEWENDK